MASSSSQASSYSLLPDMGDRPNQQATFNFPKRKFGQAKPVFKSVQPTWFQKPWLHYDQVDDKMYCIQVLRQGSLTIVGKKKDTFLTGRQRSAAENRESLAKEIFGIRHLSRSNAVFRNCRMQTLLYYQLHDPTPL